MKIAIVTALFPPDIAEPAPYIKELVMRLSAEHDIRVLVYGSIPEAVAGVPIVVVPKRLPTIFRLIRFTVKLLQEANHADYVLVHNAPSTEVPLVIASLFYRKKFLLIMSDSKIVYSGFNKFIHRIALSKSDAVISTPLPLQRPEILPFVELPNGAMGAYEKSWINYLQILNTYLKL